MKKKILKHNPDKFWFDLHRVSECGVLTHTEKYFKIRKKEVLEYAQNEMVMYTITKIIYKNERPVMIII